jgi:hypothetical protein
MRPAVPAERIHQVLPAVPLYWIVIDNMRDAGNAPWNVE